MRIEDRPGELASIHESVKREALIDTNRLTNILRGVTQEIFKTDADPATANADRRSDLNEYDTDQHNK